jgi:hypothetical protein
MSVALAVALLALLVALFTLVALVAVYARLRGLEAAGDLVVSGYPALVGRPAPASVRPGPDDVCGLVAIVDGDCALCVAVVAALADVAAAGGVRVVALTDRDGHGDGPDFVRVDTAARADLFEGYAPTVLAVDAAGTVVARRFVYADTPLPDTLRELIARARTLEGETSRA